MVDIMRLLSAAKVAAVSAGHAIRDCPSPASHAETPAVTTADRVAHEIVTMQLERIDSSVPIASEEGDRQVVADRYWLVDPLDGTKEYVAGNGEYTVNVALIENEYPVLGVIYVPEGDLLYWAGKGCGAWRSQKGKEMALPLNQRRQKPTVLVSRSHSSEQMRAPIDFLHGRGAVIRPLGSSWKFGFVAEGSADLYLRLGATYAWDTAAGQCLVEQQGGIVAGGQGRLRYPRSDTLTPGFLAATTSMLWEEWARELDLAAKWNPGQRETSR